MAEAEEKRICVGMIAAAHGIKGEVKFRSFTADPVSVTRFGPLGDEQGRRSFRLRFRGQPKDGVFIAAIEGVADRNGAEALKGLRLYVGRDRLPPADLAEGEYYHADLLGLEAYATDGRLLGRVIAVENYGASDLLEVQPAGTALRKDTVLVPFTDDAVPLVDADGGRVVIDPAFWITTASSDAAEQRREAEAIRAEEAAQGADGEGETA